MLFSERAAASGPEPRAGPPVMPHAGSGLHPSAAGLAASERIGGGQLGRILRRHLLGPDSGEARTAPGRRWEHQLAPHALAGMRPLSGTPTL